MSKESTSESLHESKERTIGPLLQELKETETAKEDDLLSNAVTRMLYHDYSQLPVLSTEGKYVGFISWKSIVAASRNHVTRDFAFIYTTSHLPPHLAFSRPLTS